MTIPLSPPNTQKKENVREPAGDGVKALILVGSLKPDEMESHTLALAVAVANEMRRRGAEVDISYLPDFQIIPGVARDSGDDSDQMDEIFAQIEAADIVVFATPIWWNQPSSYLQKVIERMTTYDDEYIESGKSDLYGKVGGCIVTGTDDGFQSCMSRFYCLFSQLGFTVPPEAFATWAGTSLADVTKNKDTREEVATMARNLVAWANLLKDSRIGETVQEDKTGKDGILAS